MLKRIVIPVMLVTLSAGICVAQSKEEVKVRAEPTFYRLDLVIKEVDEGRVTNSRSYTTTASTDREGPTSVRTGSKIPVTFKAPGEITYTDVGVNVDYRNMKDLGDSLALIVSVDVSSVATSDGLPANDRTPPVIRQNRWSGAALVPFRKPTTIFSSDDVTSKRKLQVELTATPIKQ